MKIKNNTYFLIICVFSLILSSCFFSFPSESVEEEIEQVEVIFYDWDKTTILHSDNINKGENARFVGMYPHPYFDDKIATFVSWDKPLENIMEDTCFYPIFTYSDIFYTVNFYDEDENLLDSFKVKKYASLTYDKIPTKESDEYYDYKFDRWVSYNNISLDSITSNVSFYPSFEKIQHSYKVNFVDSDGTYLQTQIVKKGEYATYTGKTPNKEAREDGN